MGKPAGSCVLTLTRRTDAIWESELLRSCSSAQGSSCSPVCDRPFSATHLCSRTFSAGDFPACGSCHTETTAGLAQRSITPLTRKALRSALIMLTCTLAYVHTIVHALSLSLSHARAHAHTPTVTPVQAPLLVCQHRINFFF